MITEPCKPQVYYWEIDQARKDNTSLNIKEAHVWGNWSIVKEEQCFEKNGYQTLLQERECVSCGLLQQRRVHV